MYELTVQMRRSHLNLISSTDSAWAQEKRTKESKNIEVMNFNF